MAAVDYQPVASYAHAALDLARTRSPELPFHDFDLPGLTLRVATDVDNWLALTRRAVVDDPALRPTARRRIDVVSMDRVRHPEMPPSSSLGLANPVIVAEAMSALGIDGSHFHAYGLWRFFDPAAGQGVEMIENPKALPDWDFSFPMRDFLHWGLQSIGWRLVHSGTLGVNGRGALIIGAGGSGKSGTTLAGLTRGLQTVGDDYIALSLDSEKPRAYPLVKLMKQDPAGFARVGIDPAEFGLHQVNWQNKYEFEFSQLPGITPTKDLEIACILMPRIAHAERSRFSPLSPRVAMLNLAPSNLYQLPGGWRSGMDFMARVVRIAPAYSLELSTDPDEIAGAIGDFIAGLP
ncbi:MAG: serine kinase [Devosia sp.]